MEESLGVLWAGVQATCKTDGELKGNTNVVRTCPSRAVDVEALGAYYHMQHERIVELPVLEEVQSDGLEEVDSVEGGVVWAQPHALSGLAQAGIAAS